MRSTRLISLGLSVLFLAACGSDDADGEGGVADSGDVSDVAILPDAAQQTDATMPDAADVDSAQPIDSTVPDVGTDSALAMDTTALDAPTTDSLAVDSPAPDSAPEMDSAPAMDSTSADTAELDAPVADSASASDSNTRDDTLGDARATDAITDAADSAPVADTAVADTNVTTTCATANCSANALCAESAAGAVCTCEPGYAGNGQTCTDIDECQIDNGGCGSATTMWCRNNPGAAPTCGSLADLDSYAIRCTFSTASGGSGTCTVQTGWNGLTDRDNMSLFGGQDRLSFAVAGVAYDAGAEVLSFDATLQNLMSQAMGTIDGVTDDAEGVRLVMFDPTVTAGSGGVAAANADGIGFFMGAPRDYYRLFSGKLAQDEVSASEFVALSVPPSVQTFTVHFLVSTKVQAKLVVNEILANPGGTISDANGEWFEVYNAGLFPVNMEGFRIGDSASSGDRPLHRISSPLDVAAGGYVVFGNTTNTVDNGGVPVDYAYGAALQLSNGTDVLRIVSPDGFVSDTPTAGCGNLPRCVQTNFVEIERVGYAIAATSAQNGISRELKNPAFDNVDVDGAQWSDAAVSAVYGPGGRGTPGAQNSAFTP